MHNDKKISRRNVLRGAVVAAGAVPVLLSGMTAAYAKVPQQSVGYQHEPKNGQHCSVCTNYVDPNQCKLVEGNIDPNGYCNLFKAKP